MGIKADVKEMKNDIKDARVSAGNLKDTLSDINTRVVTTESRARANESRIDKLERFFWKFVIGMSLIILAQLAVNLFQEHEVNNATQLHATVRDGVN